MGIMPCQVLSAQIEGLFAVQINPCMQAALSRNIFLKCEHILTLFSNRHSIEVAGRVKNVL